MAFKTLQGTLASAVADAGTFSGSYPAGTLRGDYVNGQDHILIVNQSLFRAPEDFTVSLGDTTWTITQNTGATLPAGATYRVQLDMPGATGELVDASGVAADNTVNCPVVLIDLGNPLTADADGVSTVQLKGAAGDLTITGAAASGGVATFDVARNVTLTGATTDHSAVVVTVTGTDVYGAAVVETFAGPNNSTVAGKKAFKTVTQVAVGAAIATTGISVGFGDVLGLPVKLPITSMVLKEIEDSAAASAGTLVAGLSALTKSTATTADVRGTYDPSSACNGTKSFQLIAAIPDATDKGQVQYSA